MIKYNEEISKDMIMHVAEKMVTAAITAPKGSGRDTVVGAVLSGSDKDRVARKLMALGEEYDEAFMRRDAEQLSRVECVVVLAARKGPFGISHCTMCGFESCAKMAKTKGTCAMSVTDLGIAIGSAVSLAADNRIDNRVMYSVGKAVTELDIFPEEIGVCYGIPLSVSSKSIFFDRDPSMVLK